MKKGVKMDMIIDFKNIEAAVHKNFRGGEKEVTLKVAEEGKFKLLEGKLVPGATIGLHSHDLNAEIIFIVSGNATIYTGTEYANFTSGMAHICQNGAAHSLQNLSDEDVVFFAVIAS